ncbi:restriction endonuclease subunit S [Romboutsia sp. CE17]|uniref:restriction endonuclease subunit S n=1 Tax=Romboutsia sp. CE17 TaxID=2724150 RepID=UPI001442DAEA|nr:restriction endonuclease subunit S [Romboutsia sp. CE17]QJA08586.1 restriction endonuclease subunit S [Romboutsia sp. CE17]
MSCKIKDLCIKIGSGGTPSRKNKSYYECGSVKWLKTKELNDTIIYDTEEKITEEALSKSSAKIFPKNTVVMAMYGATVGKLGILGDDISTNQACCNMVLNEKVCNYKFLYYSLIYNRENLINLANGAAQQNLNVGIIGNYEIDRPDLEEQEKIANILSSLDDKIELNNEMNKTLEEMAQALFKRWFVDFEFPNENGEPYKSSDGEMVESELGMIPKGWEVSCIYDLAEYINGTSFKAKDYSDSGLPIIKIAELKNGITEGTKFFAGEKDNKFYLKNKDILFSWSGNPDTSIDTFIWYKGDAILNQHIFKVIPKIEDGYSFIYLMLKHLKTTFTNIARNKQTTGLGHVTVKDLKELKISINYERIKDFAKIAKPIVDKIIENNNNTELITNIRDNLLPKLMSGEIRVK